LLNETQYETMFRTEIDTYRGLRRKVQQAPKCIIISRKSFRSRRYNIEHVSIFAIYSCRFHSFSSPFVRYCSIYLLENARFRKNALAMFRKL